MTALRRLTSSWRLHAFAADAALAVAITVVVQQETWTSEWVRGSKPALAVAGLAMTLPLAWRRRWPVAVAVTVFAALAVHPSLGLIIAFQVARRTSDYFAARPARELCYIVVGREEKYAAKSFIDTFVYRGGDALGAGAFGLVGVVAPVVALPLCAAFIAIAVFLGLRQRRLATASSTSSARP